MLHSISNTINNNDFRQKDNKYDMRGYLFLKNGFVPGEVLFENGTITEVNELPETALDTEERDNYVIPGLIDIHLHGCVGVDFCDCVDDEYGDAASMIERMVTYERSVGVTSICPTTMTYDEKRLTAIMRSVASYRKNHVTENDVPENTVTENAAPNHFGIVGVHLEGPFISEEKCGAQNPGYIMAPDAAMIRRLDDASGGLVRLVAIAPETDGAIECIRALSSTDVLSAAKSKIQCSVAHTTADYDTALAAINAGATHVTHLYNAMPEFSKRNPGVVGAAFDNEDTYVELICDGIHVHPSVIRATFKMFGSDRVVLISDSMEATGMPDGEYALGGQKVIKRGRTATLPDGTIAGSVTNLFECMKMAVQMGVSAEDAIKAATVNPAKSIGLSNTIGEIAAGKKAHLLVCDGNLNLREVIC